MSKKVLILGGMGNGSVIANAIIDANQRGIEDIEFVGYLNDRLEIGSRLEGWPVLGKLKDIGYFLADGYSFINTIYKIAGQKERIELFEKLQIPEISLASFVHPLAYLAPNVNISPGTVIMPNASISSGTELGKCCLIMVGATIGHNCKIGEHCHFAAQSCISSSVTIEDGVHIGLNACVRENVSIGRNAALGMGSVLLHDLPADEIWAENPARFLRKTNLQGDFEILRR